jgi:hypothetical protein
MNKYPGDLANPEDVARWMAAVAQEEFGLSGILPVMTSCVELTDAWTAPGDVKDVPGYLGAVDFDSLGYFQQRPSQGWGTREQIIGADYALRAFCGAAARLKDFEWNKDTTDAGVLGRWCQEVQRSGVPDAYRDKGYPLARKLLQASPGLVAPETASPQRKVGADKDGWIIDLKTNEYLYTNANVTYRSDNSGWLYAPSPESPQKEPLKKDWTWPTDLQEVGLQGDGSYVDLHPSRYDTVWRGDIEEWARYLVDKYDVWCNTYFDHPPEEEVAGYYDDVSFDVWHSAGRGNDIDPAVGQQIFNELFNYKGKPDISWIIWQATIYHAGNKWAGQPFGFNKHTWHNDHIHVTYH